MGDQYADIEELYNKQNTLLQQQQNKQNEIVQQQTDMQVAEFEKNKEEIEKEANKTTKGLYTEYQKQANPYGAQAEQLASQGLANSGYSESSKVALYNNYQKNVTETLNNATKLKADVDFQIAQAKKEGNILAAQNALALYQQQAQMLMQNYELKENRKQFLYQQERDKVADNQWQKTFDEQLKQNELEEMWRQKNMEYQQQRDEIADNQWQSNFDENVRQYNQNMAYQQNRDQVSDDQWRKSYEESIRQYNENMAYQKERDKVADNQWLQQYLLSKKVKASSSSSSSSRSSSSSNSSKGQTVAKDDGVESNSTENKLPEASLISNDTIKIKYYDENGNERTTTLTLTESATPEVVVKWGQKYGVDLSEYVY